MFGVWAGQRLLPVTYILENYSKAPLTFYSDILNGLQVEIKQTKFMYLLYLQILIVCYLQKAVYCQIVYRRRAAATKTSDK